MLEATVLLMALANHEIERPLRTCRAKCFLSGSGDSHVLTPYHHEPHDPGSLLIIMRKCTGVNRR